MLSAGKLSRTRPTVELTVGLFSPSFIGCELPIASDDYITSLDWLQPSEVDGVPLSPYVVRSMKPVRDGGCGAWLGPFKT